MLHFSGDIGQRIQEYIKLTKLSIITFVGLTSGLIISEGHDNLDYSKLRKSFLWT